MWELLDSISPDSVSREEAEYIYGYFCRLENVICADGYYDEASGKSLEDVIDLESWVLKYLVDEVSKNEGGGATSSYFYKKQGDEKIYAGPVWDYDKAFGNSQLWSSPYGLTYCSWHPSATDWYARLYGYAPAREMIGELYGQRIRPYLVEAVGTYIDEWAQRIHASYDMNFVRWGKSIVASAETTVSDPGMIENTSQELKNWLNDRIAFLDSAWIDGTEYVNIIHRLPEDIPDDLIVIKKGQIPSGRSERAIMELDKGEWLNTYTGEAFDPNKPIYEDVTVYELRKEAETERRIPEEELGLSLKDKLYRKAVNNKELLICVALTGALIVMLLILTAKDIRRNGKRGAGRK